jgi:hypothetical protein
MPESWMLLEVPPETLPVAREMVLMRMPLAELETVEWEIVTLLTVLSSRPPTEPIERPWPPEQVPPVKTMFWMRYQIGVSAYRS